MRTSAARTSAAHGRTTGTPSALPPNWVIFNGYLIGPRADLFGVNLSGANLSGVDLAYAGLQRAILTGAILTGANLAAATLNSSNLVDANLTGANLTGAFLGDANLTRANLTGANLTGARRFRHLEHHRRHLVEHDMPEQNRRHEPCALLVPRPLVVSCATDGPGSVTNPRRAGGRDETTSKTVVARWRRGRSEATFGPALSGVCGVGGGRGVRGGGGGERP